MINKYKIIVTKILTQIFMAKNSKTQSVKCDHGGIVTDKLLGGKTCSKLNGCQNRGTSACKC